MMRSLVVCIVLSIAGVSAAAENTSQDTLNDSLNAIKDAYVSAKLAMPLEFDGVRLSDEDKDAASIISLNRQWESLGEYLALKAQFERPILPHDYAQIVASLDPDLQVNAVALDLRTVVIAATRGQVGHVMVVASDPSVPATVWHISNYQDSNLSTSEELRCWTSNGYGNRSCYFRSIGKLADTARREHRFFIDGAYAQVAGGVTVSQLSVWKWADGIATPIYAASYDSAADIDDHVLAARDVITIRERGAWTSLFACAACDGRQLLRQLRVTDENVVDLGVKSLTPEIDFIDTLFTQVAARKSVATLASDSVVAAVQSMNAVRGKDGGPLLLIDAPKVERTGTTINICLHVESSLPARFVLRESPAGFRAVGMLPGTQCVFEGS